MTQSVIPEISPKELRAVLTTPIEKPYDGNTDIALEATVEIGASGQSYTISGLKGSLGIAVALSHHPKLLILDEATSGLDPVMRDEILDIFNDFTRDESHAILISSHIVSDLEKICDYVAFLHKGNLVLFEEKDRLLEKYGIIQCTEEQLQELNQSAVIGVKYSSYNVEAVVLRDQIPEGFKVHPISIEDLFIFMIKGVH